MSEKKKNTAEKPKFAPGVHDEEVVLQDATKEDKKKGNTTRITRVYLDEYDSRNRR